MKPDGFDALLEADERWRALPFLWLALFYEYLQGPNRRMGYQNPRVTFAHRLFGKLLRAPSVVLRKLIFLKKNYPQS